SKTGSSFFDARHRTPDPLLLPFQSPKVITLGGPCGLGRLPAALRFQTITVVSGLAETSCVPSPVLATAEKPPSGAWNWPSSLAVAASHRRMVRSGLADTRLLPSGVKHRAGVAAKAAPTCAGGAAPGPLATGCAMMCRRSLPVAVSHRTMRPSRL